MKKSGRLILVPTPLDDEALLDEYSRQQLKEAYQRGDHICVEEAKPARRRWIMWGLPREAIEALTLYNEHTREEMLPTLLEDLKKGKNVYLLSDEGLPAFCDPGQKLVDTCHKEGVTVSSLPFPNSVILALALSGFDHGQFVFWGFPPKRGEDRDSYYRSLAKDERTGILMDTPYRLSRTLEELVHWAPERRLCLALDLNSPEEEVVRGKPSELLRSHMGQKREFVLLLDHV